MSKVTHSINHPWNLSSIPKFFLCSLNHKTDLVNCVPDLSYCARQAPICLVLHSITSLRMGGFFFIDWLLVFLLEKSMKMVRHDGKSSLSAMTLIDWHSVLDLSYFKLFVKTFGHCRVTWDFEMSSGMLNEPQEEEDEDRGSRGQHYQNQKPEMLTGNDHSTSSRKLVLANILLTV